jgi:hypothetical protein
MMFPYGTRYSSLFKLINLEIWIKKENEDVRRLLFEVSPNRTHFLSREHGVLLRHLLPYNFAPKNDKIDALKLLELLRAGLLKPVFHSGDRFMEYR